MGSITTRNAREVKPLKPLGVHNLSQIDSDAMNGIGT